MAKVLELVNKSEDTKQAIYWPSFCAAIDPFQCRSMLRLTIEKRSLVAADVFGVVATGGVNYNLQRE